MDTFLGEAGVSLCLGGNGVGLVVVMVMLLDDLGRGAAGEDGAKENGDDEGSDLDEDLADGDAGTLVVRKVMVGVEVGVKGWVVVEVCHGGGGMVWLMMQR